MSSEKYYQPNDALDLKLERVVDVPVELVWRAWTEPEHLIKWFTPAPWTTVNCKIDLRPGGIFETTMRSPDGQEHCGPGCYLEIIPQKRLVWTNILTPGFRPASEPFLPFTAIINFQSEGNGTRYTAIAMHTKEEVKEQHAKLGFVDGWGTALDQLVAHVKESMSRV